MNDHNNIRYNEIYNFAKKYEELGFKMLRILPRSKRPAGTWINGTDAYTDAEYYKENKSYGIGVVGGAASGIYVIDVDNRKDSEKYFDQFGIDISSYRSKTACFHRGNQNKYKLVFRNPNREEMTYLNMIHTEFRADGKHQDIFPPSIHEEGQQYIWETGLDNMIDLPAEIKTVWNMEAHNKNKLIESTKIKSDEKRKTRTGDNVFDIYNKITGGESALRDSGQYVPVGTKWKPISSSNTAGIVIYDGYVISSHHMASDPMANHINPSANGVLAYTPFHMLWYLDYNGDVTAATAEAYRICEKAGYCFDDPGTINNYDELVDRMLEKQADQYNITKPTETVPEDLLRIPGKAQGLVDAFNKSSLIYQPQFAVHTSLAIVATLMGRRFKTENLENLTNFYFSIVGDSSAGKNHCRKFINNVLGMVEITLPTSQNGEEVTYNASKLIIGEEYKSSAGVFRACVKKPSHICVIDEAGMKQQSQNNTDHGQGTKGRLTDIWSCATSMISKGTYSGGDITQKDLEDENKKGAIDDVWNPCVSTFTISTPSTYYAAMKGGDIDSGYLGRHLIVESVYLERDINIDAPRIQDCIGPETLNWLKNIFSAYTYSPNADNFNPAMYMETVNNPLMPPAFIPMHISSEAKQMFKGIFNEIIQKYGNDNPLVMKGMEMTVRISMVVAMSCETTIITAPHVKWSKEYVCYYLGKMVKSAALKIASSQYESDWKEVYELIEGGGTNGANARDFNRKSSAWKGLTPKKQEELLKTIINAADISFVVIDNGKPGIKRTAWVSENNFNVDIHTIVEYDFDKHRQKVI
jgi:hypothetical protein